MIYSISPITALRRQFAIYRAISEMVPKTILMHVVEVWLLFFVQILSITVYYSFWQAVFAEDKAIGGLNATQTLNYILLARIFSPLILNTFVNDISYLIRTGGVAIELARPIDLQINFYAQSIGYAITILFRQIPLFLIAVLFFGLELPTDLLKWFCFVVSFLLGHAVIFGFDWMFCSFVFFTTEGWGLSVLQQGIVGFFGGAIIPLSIMPNWLQTIAALLPVAQGLYVPVSLLCGALPITDAPSLWLIQFVWFVGTWLVSRKFFNLALRKVTIQGG